MTVSFMGRGKTSPIVFQTIHHHYRFDSGASLSDRADPWKIKPPGTPGWPFEHAACFQPAPRSGIGAIPLPRLLFLPLGEPAGNATHSKAFQLLTLFPDLPESP
jgi:hypothetical protein